MTGQTISHFKVLDRLGGGGMGVVYVAEDLHLDRQVALKFLPPHLSTDQDANRRFIQEAKAASGLNHPNVCTIHEIGHTEDGQLFIAMARYEGETLKQKLESGPLAPEEAADIARQVAEGLREAHGNGIVHRDIKPANIFIANGDRAVILDFGLVKLMDSADLTKSGSTLGTARYMSPEQVRAEPLDHRTDLWSLGVILYEMLVGKRPFEGEYEQALGYSILNESPVSVEVLQPQTPESLSALTANLLKKDPGERVQTAAEVVEQLRSVLGEFSSVSSGIDGNQSPSSARQPGTKQMLAAAGTVLTIIILIWIVVDSRTRPVEPAAPEGPAPAIAVLPFDVEGDENLGYLHNGMVRLLSARLDGMGELRSIDPNAVFAHIERDATDAPVLDVGIDITKRFGAANFVLGSVMRIGGQLQMSASLYSPDGQVQKDAVIDVGADTLLLSGVDELARILLADRLSTDVWELPGLAVAGTQSFDALRHYLRGEEAMHHDDYRTATEEFRGAVLGDSLFALAWYRFSHAVSWLSADSMRVSQEAFETALRHSQNLPRATRRTIEAENLSRQGRHREGMELLELVLSENPENTLAWLMLGDGQYHHNPYSGEPSSAGRDALERALDLDPDLAEARLHIFRFMTRDGEYADAESLATRMNFHGYLQPADTVALRIMSAEDSLSRQLLLDEVDDIPATAFRLAWVFENPEIAEQLLNQASASQEAREGDCLTRRSAIWGLHEMAFARGRVRTALTPIRARGIEYRRQMQRLISLLVYYPFSETALRELRNLTSSASIHCSDSSTKPRSLRDFAGGVAAWRIGDSDILEKAIRSLDIASDSLMLDNLEMVFAGTLRALGLWSAGKADRALASLDSALVPITFSSHHQDFYAQSIPRFVRAEILFSEGRYEEAIKWYASVNDGPHLDNGFPLFPPATFRRAQCYDRLGDTSRAIELYTRSIEIWEVADEELQPMVTEARQSLDRLMGAAAREPS